MIYLFLIGKRKKTKNLYSTNQRKRDAPPSAHELYKGFHKLTKIETFNEFIHRLTTNTETNFRWKIED